jgi:hypothetical protein
MLYLGTVTAWFIQNQTAQNRHPYQRRQDGESKSQPLKGM